MAQVRRLAPEEAPPDFTALAGELIRFDRARPMVQITTALDLAERIRRALAYARLESIVGELTRRGHPERGVLSAMAAEIGSTRQSLWVQVRDHCAHYGRTLP